MKKILLFSLTLLFSTSLLAQNGFKKINHPDSNKALKRTMINHKDMPVPEMEFVPETNIVQAIVNKGANGVSDAVIMTTQYDLQTNSGIGNRIFGWADGSVSAVTTWGNASAPSFPDRGTGYNFYNGSSWGAQPTSRVEPFRSGWPSITRLGENGEMLVSHGGSPWGIYRYYRETKGTGAWTSGGIIPGAPAPYEIAWPRITTSGEDHNNVHVISGDQPDTSVPQFVVFYNNSQDGGQTWQGWTTPPEVDVAFYNNNIGADDYIMASNGDNVAILFCSSWYDLFFVKSTDNGQTWEKTVVWEHPYPTFDFNTTITTDTLWAPDNSANIAIDNNGMVHIVWATARVIHEAPGSSYNFFPYTDGIGYWNESMGTIPTNPSNPHKTLDPEYLESLNKGIVVGWVPDLNNNGELDITLADDLNYRTLGLSTQPSIAVDNNGSISIFYSTPDESRTIEDLNYRSLYASYKDGIFGSWYNVAENITGGIFHLFEEVYSVTCAPNGYDGTFYAMYAADNLIGLAMDDQHLFQDNKIYVAKVTPVVIGVNENVNPVTEISSVYPNPVNSEMNIDVNLSKSSKNVEVSVHTITGQRVHNQTINTMVTGMNKISVNVSDLNTGVYFCTITVDGFKETRKFIVR
ncbi:MAG: hypothetical protein FD155_3430 [Bacteroidetes bacterium]|nr:MAG: hypothetical protein FD155_3430 [Bacteroidota bacterium]